MFLKLKDVSVMRKMKQPSTVHRFLCDLRLRLRLSEGTDVLLLYHTHIDPLLVRSSDF